MRLDVQDLRTHFFGEEGTVKAVDGVSLSLAPGEILGLVGESGSGKSVTGLSILRLVPDPPGRIVGGKILLDGEDLLGVGDERMRKVRGDRIAMIFQDPMTSLNPYLTIGEQLAEVLELHRGMSRSEARDKSIAMLKSVGIPAPAARFDDYPHHLSGGMRQRVMIGMALLCDPAVLIADEPTTALDVTIQAQILDLIVERKSETGLSVLLITHDLGVVAKVCDRVAVMYAGRIVEQGPVDAIFADPRHPYTIGLKRSIPRIDGPESGSGASAAADARADLVPIRGAPPSLAKLPPGCPFHPRCDHALDVCKTIYPEPRSISVGHTVKCHAEDVRLGR